MITVKATKYREALDNKTVEWFGRGYLDREGVRMREGKTISSSSDFSDASYERISEDNGKTFGEWKDVYVENGYEKLGEHERNFPANITGKWNPVHKHYVGLGMERIFNGGHEKGLAAFWRGDPTGLIDHVYVGVRFENGEKFHQLVKYEEGGEFNHDDPMHPDYSTRNIAFRGSNLVFDTNGDILFPIGVPAKKCCELAGADVNEIFPSCPEVLRNLMFIRGVWNGEKYEFFPSRPILISDLQSSRGVDEPTIVRLNSGRIVIVFRGSNMRSSKWNTRIEPGTPGFKWYTWSDDGGKTFTPAMPWHFDDGEVIYSAATISYFIEDERTGKHYWFGNITDHHVYANNPRWPLQIVEIDETYGTAKKESFTVIDDRREGESERIELSNFNLFQNRENGNFEIFMTKRGQFADEPLFKGEVWHYEISVTE